MDESGPVPAVASDCPPCILCGGVLAICLRDVADYEYRTTPPVAYAACGRCGLISQVPLPSLDAIPAFYPSDYRPHQQNAEGGLLPFLKRRQAAMLARRIARHVPTPSRTLEIGCGSGFLLLALQQQGYAALWGSDMTAGANELLQARGIGFRAADIEREFPFEQTFDAIILNNVVEHLREPIAALVRCRQHLSPSGKLICITPDSRSWMRGIFKHYWSGLHAPRHLHIFGSGNLDLLGQKIGLAHVAFQRLIDPGDIAVSAQNALQAIPFVRSRLSQGLSKLTPVASVACAPVCIGLSLLGNSGSIMAIYSSAGP